MKALFRKISKTHKMYNWSIVGMFCILLAIFSVPYWTIHEYYIATSHVINYPDGMIVGIIMFAIYVYFSLFILLAVALTIGNIKISIRNRREQKALNPRPNKSTTRTVFGNTVGKEYCDYCGYEFSPNEKKCPSCGATKKK